MRVEVKKPVPLPVPTQTFVLTLSEEEMKAVMEVANFNGLLSETRTRHYYVKSLDEVRHVFKEIWWNVPEATRDALHLKSKGTCETEN